MQTLKTKSLAWHHFVEPSVADIEWLKNQYQLHSLLLDEIAEPTARPRVEAFDGSLYLVMHFPLFDAKSRKTYAAEVDFILTKKDLISIAYESILPLEEAFKKCSTDASRQELWASKTPARLLFYVLKELYAFTVRELDHIQDNINTVEEAVFAAPYSSGLIEELATVRRDLIDFRRAMKPQQSTLDVLATHGEKLFGKSLRPFFEELLAEYRKIWNLLENQTEAVDALYDNHVTLLSVKQGEAVKILTMMAFMTFPLSLLAAVFAIGATDTPIIGRPNDFWVIVGIMLAAAAIMLAFFKRKRWI